MPGYLVKVAHHIRDKDSNTEYWSHCWLIKYTLIIFNHADFRKTLKCFWTSNLDKPSWDIIHSPSAHRRQRATAGRPHLHSASNPTRKEGQREQAHGVSQLTMTATPSLIDGMTIWQLWGPPVVPGLPLTVTPSFKIVLAWMTDSVCSPSVLSCYLLQATECNRKISNQPRCHVGRACVAQAADVLGLPGRHVRDLTNRLGSWFWWRWSMGRGM